jgi:hypothetical protein
MLSFRLGFVKIRLILSCFRFILILFLKSRCRRKIWLTPSTSEPLRHLPAALSDYIRARIITNPCFQGVYCYTYMTRLYTWALALNYKE